MNDEMNQSVESTLAQPGMGFGAKPAPQQGGSNADNIMKMAESAFGLPKTSVPTPNAGRTGLFDAGVGLPQTPDQPAINAQMREIYNTALTAVRNKARGLLGAGGVTQMPGAVAQQPMTVQQPQIAQPQPQTQEPTPKPQEPAPTPVGGLAAQGAGVYERKRGGVSSYGYRNEDGVGFDLPDGIDINDDAAVSSAIAANKADYDMMNELYNDEEV